MGRQEANGKEYRGKEGTKMCGRRSGCGRKLEKRARTKQRDDGYGRRISPQGPMSEIHRRLRRDHRHPTPLFASRPFKMRILTINQAEKERNDPQERTIGNLTVDSVEKTTHLV